MRHKLTLTLAAFSILATLCFILENFLPKPLPFFRIGLANVFVLLILFQLGFRAALVITISKVFLGSLFSGLIFTPILIFSLLSSLISLIAMYLAIHSKFKFSLIGISISGAVFHNLCQLLIAYFIFIRNTKIFSLIPLLLILALIGGGITGIFATLLDKKMNLKEILQKNI
ncbi:MAG: Gx transporter family protein [Candidatus Cloacimonadota bacterium]|nr:Gx transporter family protein [Candidatus Cloacimonadota bacterium]